MSRLLFRGEPLRVVSAECFAPLPDSGHRECTGRTGSGASCVCSCHSQSAVPTFRVVRVVRS